MAQSISEAVKAMKGGDITSWVSTSDNALGVGEKQRDLSDKIASAVDELRQAWSGKGADAAINRLAVFGSSAGVAGDSLVQNASNVQTTAAYYKTVSAQLVDVDPPTQKIFASPTPWAVDSDAEIAQYNEIQKRNVEVYTGYYNQAQTQGASLQGDFGGLKPFDAGTVSVDKGTAGTTPGIATTGHTTGGKHRAPDTTSGTVTPGTSSTPGSGPGQTPGGVPGGSTPGANTPEGATNPGSDSTGSAAFRPPAALPGGGVAGNGGVNVSGPGSVPGGGFTGDLGPFVGAPGGLSGTGPGVGSGTGSGSGSGRVPGVGTGNGQTPGAGARSGAGALEGEPVRGSRGLAGSRLTGGSGGPGGMGPGAAGRGKEEDKEHKRRYGLDEVVLFPEEEENDELKGIDPATGMRVTKPTIG